MSPNYFRSINYIEGANILREDLMILKHLKIKKKEIIVIVLRSALFFALWLQNYGFPWRHTGLKSDQKSQQTQKQVNCF